MKKTVLFTVLVLSLVFNVTSYAAFQLTDEYANSIVDPATYVESLTINDGTNANPDIKTYPAGTLPTSDDQMKKDSSGNHVNRNTRIFTETTGEGSSATAVLDGSDAVFKLTGTATLADRVAIAASSTNGVDSGKKNALVRRYSAKVKLSNPSAGTTGVHVIENRDVSDIVAVLSDTGVYFSDAGAYVNDVTRVDSEGKPEKVWFVEQGEISADEWYTVETFVEILEDGYVAQDAVIYDSIGTVVGRSGYCYVEDDTNIKKTSTMSQIYTKDLGAAYAMIKDWKGWSRTDAPTKATFTFDDSDTDELTDTRKVLKLTSSIALDSNSVNVNTVKLTSETVDMTGKYSARYDDATQTIIVEATNALPYGTTFAVELDKGRMLSNSDNFLAVDYTNDSALKYEFTTPSDPFLVTNVTYTPGVGASADVSNNDVENRACIVIVSSFDADGNYLETKCERADILQGSQNQNVTGPVVTEVTGGHIQVMVWDNWDDMNCFGYYYN